MFRHIDPGSPIPLYVQIANRLRVAVATGEIPPSIPLPSVRQLAAELRVNPATVVQAYHELERDGIVETRQGAGTFVRDVSENRKGTERHREARRLVREIVERASVLGLSREDLEHAWKNETGGRG